MISFIQFVLYNFVIYVSMLFAQDVRIEIIAPDEAEAGSSFIVEIRISKDIAEGAARLQQDFPVGYTVTSKDSHYGDFSFKEQKLKFIWFKVPTDTSFTISYLVQVDPTSDGMLELGGTFSYLEDSVIKTVNIPVKKILIIPAGQQQANNLIDTSDINSLTDPLKTLCFRQVVKEGNDYIVNLLIKKGGSDIGKFAKLQESVQSGFNATYIETKESIFSFKENSVKLLWMTLPAEQQFIVKYRLTPETPGAEPELKGTFSYLINETTKVIPIKNVDFLDSPLLADITNNNNQNNNNQNNNQNNNNQNNNNNNQNQDITPESGIYYKVQIAAARQVQVNPKYYFRQYNVTEKVQLEMHEGWRKYMIGKFNVYKDARDHRVYIWQNTPIKDAFVAAYNNGTRITVQEALMIANQKWVQ